MQHGLKLSDALLDCSFIGRICFFLGIEHAKMNAPPVHAQARCPSLSFRNYPTKSGGGWLTSDDQRSEQGYTATREMLSSVPRCDILSMLVGSNEAGTSRNEFRYVLRTEFFPSPGGATLSDSFWRHWATFVSLGYLPLGFIGMWSAHPWRSHTTRRNIVAIGDQALHRCDIRTFKIACFRQGRSLADSLHLKCISSILEDGLVKYREPRRPLGAFRVADVIEPPLADRFNGEANVDLTVHKTCDLVDFPNAGYGFIRHRQALILLLAKGLYAMSVTCRPAIYRGA